MTFNGLHGFISLKIEPFMVAAVRNSNPTDCLKTGGNIAEFQREF
jgi:hypothetical protein